MKQYMGVKSLLSMFVKISGTQRILIAKQEWNSMESSSNVSWDEIEMRFGNLVISNWFRVGNNYRDTPGQRYPQTKIPLDRDTPGQRYPWTEIPLDRDTPGQRYPGQRYPPNNNHENRIMPQGISVQGISVRGMSVWGISVQGISVSGVSLSFQS